jgi:type I protein arginine methyltransferase
MSSGTNHPNAPTRVHHLTIGDTVVPVTTRTQGTGFRLWPSVGEYPVYDNTLYRFMGADHIRNTAFTRALHAAAPGAVVADLGTGKDALWAVRAAHAGARRVYAVERLPGPLEQARAKITAAGMGEVVRVLAGEATTLTLPEPAGVCVSEVIGTIGSSEGAATVLGDARDRHLTPDGVCVPARCVTMVAAVRLDTAFPTGLALHTPALRYLQAIFTTVGRPFDPRLTLAGPVASLVVSTAAPVETLDFTANTPEGRTTGFGTPTHPTLDITTDGLVHALVLWIRLWCHPDDPPVDSLRQTTSWLPLIAPLSAPGIPVTAGDRIELHWQATISTDGLHPDYQVRGLVTRRGHPDVPIHWNSPHHGSTLGTTAPYQALFPTAPSPGK